MSEILVSICKNCGHVFEGYHQVLCKNCLKDMGDEIWKSMDMNVTSNNNMDADLNTCLAADDIINIFDELGFTANEQVDVELLRHKIVEAIQKRLEK